MQVVWGRWRASSIWRDKWGLGCYHGRVSPRTGLGLFRDISLTFWVDPVFAAPFVDFKSRVLRRVLREMLCTTCNLLVQFVKIT